MEKTSEALKALQAMKQKAEEINQRKLQNYEENLTDMLASEGSTFGSAIAKMNWEILTRSAELSKAHMKCQKEKYQQIEALLEEHGEILATKLKSQQKQIDRSTRWGGLVGAGIVGMALGFAGVGVAWSLTITRPQTAALEEKNKALQQKVNDLQKKISQQPKAQPRRN